MELQDRLAEIGARVKAERKRARISQTELALLAGVSRRPIYLLESGKGAVQLDTLLKILDAFSLDISLVPRPWVARSHQGELRPSHRPPDWFPR